LEAATVRFCLVAPNVVISLAEPSRFLSLVEMTLPWSGLTLHTRMGSNLKRRLPT